MAYDTTEVNLTCILKCWRYHEFVPTSPLNLLFDHSTWRKRKHGYVRRVNVHAAKTAYTLPGRSLIANTGCKALLSSGAASAAAPLPT